MPDGFIVKSRLRSYKVQFVSNLSLAIGDQHQSQSFLIIDEKIPSTSSVVELFDFKHVIYVKANEKHKTLDYCALLIKQLVSKNIRRNHVIYAVGGGVVEDVVAFVCMVLYRGIDWVFCPTTLLAQADSCIGSKSSINFDSYKNLLGSFYPPAKVLIDVNLLTCLPVDQIKSGIGEILHFYLVAGKLKLAKALMGHYQSLLEDPKALKPYILKSLRIKKIVIERDEFDQGERLLFNYGHTFGHAIESVTNYAIHHGQAITMGMDIANFISWRRGYIPSNVFNDLHHLLALNLPKFQLLTTKWPKYLEALSRDKKNIDHNLGCILTKGPGKMFKTQLKLDNLLKEDILSYFEYI